MSEKDLQLEDTVSADRKERIIYVGPGKTRKISSITSRQNFNNEKFTRKSNKGDEEDQEEQQKVDEGTIQTSGDSKVDSAGPTQSDTISKETKKKSNSPQIEFVTGNVNPNGSSSTAQGNQPMTGRKLAEALIEKAIKQVKGDEWDDKNPPFEPDTKAEKEFKKPNNPNRSPMDTVRALAQKGMKKQQTKEETEMPKSYQEFLNQLLEYTPGPGGVTRVQGRSYGAQYHDPEGDDDADDRAPAAKPADAPKRGRGRPAGSKSGANQKVTSGKSYGGIATHSLHLPNSNR